MNFDEVIASLIEDCPGSRGAAIVDADGIPVVSLPHDATLEALVAEYAAVLREIDQAGREFQHGSLRQFFVTAERAAVVLTVIAAGYFLILILDPEGSIGRARFLSRLAGERLHPEFL